ncbi:phage baseplate assembly protein V [Escherichia coli]|uniref:phage baseplate assembly protein V n=1 Tax=Escherichia coli TaxID=562 RepID=UPI0022B72528|nr:phage baseplate assembly protein V [Escherichia coli]MCZ7350665.1 phage baseplate assembly protein V [Escherichia coli]
MNAELMRLISNIIRTGVIFDVNPQTWEVRVRSGGLETGWLRWSTARAGAFSVWVPPATGEQVAFVCIGGNPETAIIIGRLWSDDIPAPGSTLKEIIMTAPDGAVFRYDADAGALEVKGIKTASIQADTRITLDTSEVVCTRKLITATLEVQNGGEMRGSISHSGGSLTSNGITVHTHTHGGVRTGPGTTGGPQ